MHPSRSACRLLVLVTGFQLTSPAQTTLVSFTFEGTSTATIGADRATLTWNSGGSGSFVSSNVFAGQGQALSVGDFQLGEYFQLTLDASGFSSLTLGDFRSNGTGAAPRDWKISYSLTGPAGSFVDATSYVLASNTAASTTTIAGFTLPAGADNNPSIVLRLIASSSTRIDGGGSAANGTARLDSLAITGAAIPEPAVTVALAGLAALALAWCRRRAASVQQKGPPVGGP